MSDCQTRKVIEGGYCIGCGACAIAAPETFGIVMDEEGKKQAVILQSPDEQVAAKADAICPFSADAPDEDYHADRLFGHLPKDEAIGHYASLYAGHVAEGNFRRNGSSGGGVSWLVKELFDCDMIDFVVHVGAGNNEELFEYRISRSAEEALSQTKSKYYPISLESVIPQVLEEQGRGLFIGIPCFVKAVRNLALENPEFGKKVAFAAGLVCGHLKTAQFSDNFSWQMGLAPGKLTAIDFRHMEDSHDGPANQYFVKATGYAPGGELVTRVAQNHTLYGFLWGYGFFKYKACDYCDDVFAETADITFGDAWISPYLQDAKGDNILAIRSMVLKDLVEAGMAKGRLNLDPITPEEARQSQSAGLRHRREGMAVRLAHRRAKGEWVPSKRFDVLMAIENMTWRRKKIYTYREVMSQNSRAFYAKAAESGNYSLFRKAMDKHLRFYDKVLYFKFSKIIQALARKMQLSR